MTTYAAQVRKLNQALYPKDYLTCQLIRAKQYIDQHYAGPIDIDAIANEAFLSKFHFLRLFKSFYGQTPCQYLTEVRIANAKHLLLLGRSIAAVCDEVGFDSVTYFTGLFKRITGTTPAAFRKCACLKKAISKKKNS